ncbi:MAG: gamma-glutamyl-gamma-aminobutyrate hydrolase family protein [Zavarzinella sp.]
MAAKTFARPIIGINCDFYNSSKTITAHSRVNAGYIDEILRAQGIPLLIPPMADDFALKTLLNQVDGIILTGGLDMDPRRNGNMNPKNVQPMADRRDTSDRNLIKMVIDRQLPVLAIGVGMQQLNVMMGGTLHHHIPEALPGTMPHFDAEQRAHKHSAEVMKNTLLHKIYNTTELIVNSRHHQAIATLGNGLRVCATAPDKVIEAIESEDDWFCLGVQWHPEADTASALDRQLFARFVENAAEQVKPKVFAAAA